MLYNSSKGYRIHYDLQGDGTHTIVFFHGMFGSSDQKILLVIRKILNRKYRTLVFDYQGHGKSTGEIDGFCMKGLLEDARILIEKTCKGSSYSFIGFSLGAYPAILLAKNDIKIRSLFLINPATDIPRIAFNKSSNDSMSKYTDGHLKIGIVTKIRLVLELLFYDLYKDAAKIACPVFVYHSIDDDIVPYAQSVALEKHILSRKKFLFLHGENHPCEKGSQVEKEVIPEYLKFMKSLSL